MLVLGSGALPGHWASAGGAASTAAAQSLAPREVHVSLSEWNLTLAPIVVPPGSTVRFVAANDGVLPHALAVEGDGLYLESDTIGSGQVVQFDVLDLAPGFYDLYCPVGAGQHRALGQESRLIVGLDDDESAANESGAAAATTVARLPSS